MSLTFTLQFLGGRIFSWIVFSGAPYGSGIGARFASSGQFGFSDVVKEAIISLLALLSIRGAQFGCHGVEQPMSPGEA